MNHGIAKLNQDLIGLDGTIVAEKGEIGVVTAYLPEDNTFAVMFTNNRWYTFKESEEEFLRRVEYKNNEQ